ncbi:helix-turn-helix domain-containing protein [Agathobaculum butyriciproducens]|nr:helix-turn-helix domain-containing protein [Agathobaculum butyriciproducens]
MLSDNIKNLRKNKGFTQEELANKLNVVRQTVSKWEKGYSVPDAEMLKKIAEILETDVSQLLGSSIEETSNTDLVAEQLSRINEQLVIKNRRTRRIWKTIGVVILVVIIVQMILVVLGAVAFDNLKFNSDVQVEEYSEEFIDE